jgi:hypothetical protein
MTTGTTTPTPSPIIHPIPPDLPPRVERDEDGRYWLRGRFGGVGIDGPEPTAEDFEALERHDYPWGRDIFFVPITLRGEVWQQDLPSCCIDLAKRTGISNEVIAQHFVDIAEGHFRELLPLCSDREARSEQIWAVADRILWSACRSCPEMDAVSWRRMLECVRDGQAVSGVTTDEIGLYFSGLSDVIPFAIPSSAAGRKMLRDQISVVYLDRERYEGPKRVTVEGDEAEREIAEQIAHQEWCARFDREERRYEILRDMTDRPDDDRGGRVRTPRPSPAPQAV